MYVVHFLRFAARLEWNNDALQDQFYLGLKDFIKDELKRLDVEFRDINVLIDKAVRINNCIYKRKLKRKRHYVVRENRGLQQRERWPKPMQINATI